MGGQEALGMDQIIRREEKRSLLGFQKKKELFLEHFRFTTKLSRKSAVSITPKHTQPPPLPASCNIVVH